ncbi:MAG: tail fiber domain-containing protein [bacterium]|nr:tail fiber domain-containing protein [bacterium]
MTASTTRLTISSTGYIGIGTTTPYAKLSVVGPVVAEYFHATSTTATSTFAGGFSAASSLYALQNGNVGIGTASPRAKLHLGGGFSPTLRMSYGTDSLPNDFYGELGHYGNASGVSSLGGFQFIAQASSAGQNGLGFVFAQKPGSGNAVAAMVIDKSGNVGIGTTSPWGKLSITGAGATSATYGLVVADSNNSPKMVVRNDGNVGIGTTTPTSKLTIGGSAVDANVALNIARTDGATRFSVLHNGAVGIGATPSALVANLIVDLNTRNYYLYSSFPNDWYIDISHKGAGGGVGGLGGTQFISESGGAGSGQNFVFAQQTGASAATPVVVINNSGNVGIGTTSPWGKLSITGAGATSATYGLVVADSNNSPKMVVRNDGNVGIGTTSPSARFSLVGNGAAGFVAYISGANGFPPYFRFDNGSGGANWNVGMGIGALGGNSFSIVDAESGNSAINIDDAVRNNALTLRSTNAPGTVGIGTTTPLGNLSVTGLGTGTGYTFVTADLNNAPKFVIQDNGNVGIGTTSPWRVLSVTGTVGFDGLTGAVGAGSLCLSANKEVVYNSASDNCLSSTRATKHDITKLSFQASSTQDALAIIGQLQPVSFVYNQGDGRTRYGFIAEDVALIDSHLATYDASSTISGIDDRSILSVVVKAIQELWAKMQEYFARTEKLESEVDALKARVEELESRLDVPNAAPEASQPSSETSAGTAKDTPAPDDEVIEDQSDSQQTIEETAVEEPAPEEMIDSEQPPIEEVSQNPAQAPAPQETIDESSPETEPTPTSEDE